jgi:Heterokaryon incompatibility protein (HET)
MVQTRVLDLDSLELKTFQIGHLPPYVALSHVWSENLFPVSAVDDPARTKGLQLLQKAALRELGGTRLLWIDTWSIKQHDYRDKYRQIPQMGTIFETAEAVVAVTTYVFSVAQWDWNSLAFDVNGKLRTLITGSKNDPKPHQNYEILAPLLSKVAAIFLEMVRMRWFNRIWTCQEFILAKSIVWVGGNGLPLRIRPTDMLRSLTCILEKRRSEPPSGNGISEKIKLEAHESIC